MEKENQSIARFYIPAVLLILIGAFVSVYNASITHSFWYDEAYSIALIKYSFSDIWLITASDVHPPLYYYMLKIFSGIFGGSIFDLRIFSGLGIIATLLIGIFPLKRLFGERTALMFMILVLIMPVTQYLATEIRMYSWALFFVLGCSVFAYRVYLKKVFTNYIFMALFAIAAAYTHYYALVSVGFIYILLVIALLRKGRNVVRLILFSLIVLLAYSPWIPAFISQIQSVQHHFWIKIPTAKEFLLFLYYFFSPKEPSHPYTIFTLPVMSVALSIMFVLIFAGSIYVWRLPRDKRLSAGDGFVLVYVATLLITFLITYLVKPISTPRYTTCMLGPLLLGIAIYCGELWKSKGKYLVIVSFCFLTLLSVTRLISETKYNEDQDRELSEISRFFHRGSREPKTIISYIEAYPELAKLSLILPDREYLLCSPADETNYRPFAIKTIDSIESFDSFFLVTPDTIPEMGGNYRVTDKLVLSKKTILLLQKY
ncbi:glycosyltransferase family 39 protein [Dysgonomonas macrotermitis]|uniref:Dolichyl-phosphate-mannose-protein mannosyltransferase n=1 Tax=Dysgonomonas macrotermitis TaxID=1346286 RepID=A0A1M5I1H6_9BACT|nr:glycosyltransferase family 39 protein [Dysgonomonas macrotermitis]SHG22156.1 Dolichyl-phosphate-mannose-protein mannosyltransferase [Dysgonomonas macrotermitis]